MPTGDLNRSIERWIEKERESEGKNKTCSTPVTEATGSERCDGKIQVYFFFFPVIYLK